MSLTHQVEVNAVVDKIILARQNILGSREVHTESLASSLNLLIISGQTNQIIMKLLQILLCDLRRISRRIASNKHRPHNVSVLVLDIVNHTSHLVQLFRANVRAMCEAKVNKRVFSFERLLGEGLAVLVDELEGPADERAADAFAVFGDALAGHAFFLVAEVEGHSYAGAEEETAGLPAKGTEAVTRLCFFYGLVAHCR